MVNIKRIYETASKADGERILVDRLWPRGMKKEEAELDSWNKAVAPSPGLRKWFGHEPERFNEFRNRYLEELDQNEAGQKLRVDSMGKTITLLYAAKDRQHNHALVLQEFLVGRK